MKADSGTPKVTVLVPVYNQERYLRACLDSLVSQTLRELQILCIDDGSTDASPAILAEYAARDARIEVVTKENSGYGASMNKGLDMARGEYVGIVESDDFASLDMFASYYRLARRHDLDLVKSNYFEHDESGDNLVRAFGKRTALWGTFDPAKHPEVLLVPPTIWSALYRRDMLEREGIRFLETPGASYQDTSFMHRTWFASHRARIAPGAYLHYRVDNSASSVKSSTKVYEVCAEFAASEAFLAERPERAAAFSHLLQVVKYNTYRWNYDRIGLEYRTAFAQRWADECRAAQGEGVLRAEDFLPADWALIEELLRSPEAFVHAHPDGGLL